MEIKNIQKDYKKDLKSVMMSIRTTKEVSQFMKEKNISPTKLFNESIKELISKEKKK